MTPHGQSIARLFLAGLVVSAALFALPATPPQIGPGIREDFVVLYWYIGLTRLANARFGLLPLGPVALAAGRAAVFKQGVFPMFDIARSSARPSE